MILHNRVNREVLKEQIRNSTRKRTTLSFYKYFHIASPEAYRDQMYLDFNNLEVLGRIYVAAEGVNAQISVPDDRLEDFREFISSDKNLSGIRLNIAVDDNGKSFYKLKIQVRHKIVADGLNDQTFDVTKRGKHLSAEEFNELAANPNTIIIDMRNHYESEVGHFENAICPDVDTFREALPLVEEMLKDQKDKNLVMYCTGGIRCEKASAYYKHKGFKNVFQLDGGIIEYARQARDKNLPNLFKGKNFVFDERLGERISEEIISVCHQCGKPADTHTNCVNEGCHLLFIQCEECAEAMEGCCSEECREVIHLPEEARKEMRKNINRGRQVYRKGRSPKLLFKKDKDLYQDNSEITEPENDVVRS